MCWGRAVLGAPVAADRRITYAFSISYRYRPGGVLGTPLVPGGRCRGWGGGCLGGWTLLPGLTLFCPLCMQSFLLHLILAVCAAYVSQQDTAAEGDR